MQHLRQSTASQEISLGQFLDSTDGNTEEGGLTIANTDIKIRKHGGTTLINKNSGGATVISNGVYQATLDATDTGTAGMLEIYVHVSGALAVKSVYMVLTATAFDALYTGTYNNVAATDIVSSGAITTLTGAVVNVDLVDTMTTYTGNTLQTADHTAGIADIPTNSEFNARTLVAANYFDPTTDTVANVTLVATTTTNTDMRGTDSANTTVPDAAGTAPTASEINAEMVDVLETDTHAEPSGVVGATASIKDMLNWVKTLMRNKMTQTSTTTLLRNDTDTSTISTSTVSDDTTTFIRGKHT